jgi:hypothetical protein
VGTVFVIGCEDIANRRWWRRGHDHDFKGQRQGVLGPLPVSLNSLQRFQKWLGAMGLIKYDQAVIPGQSGMDGPSVWTRAVASVKQP